MAGVTRLDFTCATCGALLDAEHAPCMQCGSMVRRVELDLHAEVQSHGMLTLKARRGGHGRPFVEQWVGASFRWATGQWVRLRRVVDRERDEYHEVVSDPSTGAVIHQTHEPLSQHQGHGAAKSRRA